ncbi:TetR/AcrR family transcriptional regulator [Alloalcanivorax xenomutans]|uniref:TetR/AcrR family transcriptional regulator n=1 Tax=Alloalcanivorax xenomutans TaxID=1094342 RepID=UPI0009EB40F9|nr:TetR/AcrR family transcriptional regulator [Alloalcanivorax xenomutans]
MTRKTPSKPLPQPHKRPSQARAVFTVQALYDGFVRIWRRDGPAAATTRAIAEESGYAVGTLYDYFPNRTALLSGYVRHCMDVLCQRLSEEDTAMDRHCWEERLRRAVSLTLDEDGQAPYFDREMLMMEGKIATAAHHQRAFRQLVDAWGALVAGWPDRPGPAVTADTLETLVLALWGARRYTLLLATDTPPIPQQVDRLAVMARALLTS